MNVTAALLVIKYVTPVLEKGHLSRVYQSHTSGNYQSANWSSAACFSCFFTFRVMSVACPESLLKASLPVMTAMKSLQL